MELRALSLKLKLALSCLNKKQALTSVQELPGLGFTSHNSIRPVVLSLVSRCWAINSRPFKRKKMSSIDVEQSTEK